MPKITFHPSDKMIEVAAGGNLLEAAADADLHINASCGGDGTCGKCKVLVEGARIPSNSGLKLSDAEIAQGYVLACQTGVFDDIVVRIPVESELLARGRDRIKTLATSKELWNEQLATLPYDPPVVKKHLKLMPPSLQDSVSDASRILRILRKELGVHEITFDLHQIKSLPGLVRQKHWECTVTLLKEDGHYRILGVEPGNTADRLYALAVDVGTTTCVAQIIDLNERRIIGEASEYNRQVACGDDVISRVVFANKGNGLEILQTKVVTTLDRLIGTLLKETGVKAADIACVTLAGNTVMTHLLLGVTPAHIREAPYVPVFRFPPRVRGADIGLRKLPHAVVIGFPCVASYLGGDITSGIVASDVIDDESLSLYIDIGTNGEIVLGNSEWLLGCSCSAGPAFEGAGVKDGVRSVDGAIERVSIEPDTHEAVFTTIGGKAAIGICGSGLIDLIAELFRAGIIDKRGKFNHELGLSRVREGKYGWEFVVAWAKVTGVGRDIVITEVDIDNLMRAKAAIYAGITTLVESVGAALTEIDRILIAGSFGNYIRVQEAIAIGLLPDLPVDKYHFVGNGSLYGAAKASVSSGVLERAGSITRSMSYLELSAEAGFMDKYVSALFLPHTNDDLFPSVSVEGKALKKAM